MMFAPSSPESLKRLIDWLEQEQRYPELLQQAKHWQSEPLELECDFNRMCIGPTKLLVPPYESVYRDVGRQIHTDRTLEVADFYQQLGLVTDTGFNEPADYIAMSWSFCFVPRPCAISSKTKTRPQPMSWSSWRKSFSSNT